LLYLFTPATIPQYTDKWDHQCRRCITIAAAAVVVTWRVRVTVDLFGGRTEPPSNPFVYGGQSSSIARGAPLVLANCVFLMSCITNAFYVWSIKTLFAMDRAIAKEGLDP
jgi:hypothetical protein